MKWLGKKVLPLLGGVSFLAEALVPRVVVVGAGASGYFAAITAKRECPEVEVLLLEGSKKPLRKVLKSGGGRCNVMHDDGIEVSALIENYPRGKNEVRGSFTKRFGPRDTRNWFEAEGVELKLESDGRMFPTSDNSETIAGALERAAKKAGVTCHLSEAVVDVASHDDRSLLEPAFVVATKKNAYSADSVVLATGSAPAGYGFAKNLGHPIHAPYPSLFSFRLTSNSMFKDLAGVSVREARLSFGQHVSIGPLLITHRGLSGPCALKLSAFAAKDLQFNDYTGELRLSVVPEYTRDDVKTELQRTRASSGSALVSAKKHRPYAHLIPYRLWTALVRHSDCAPIRWAELDIKRLSALVDALTDLTLPFSGKDTNKDEFVTAGGVDLKSVDTRTMQSKLHPGLHFAGELLDVDAVRSCFLVLSTHSSCPQVTGGFNFQHCWTSGYVAGTSAAKYAAATCLERRIAQARLHPPPEAS